MFAELYDIDINEWNDSDILPSSSSALINNDNIIRVNPFNEEVEKEIIHINQTESNSFSKRNISDGSVNDISADENDRYQFEMIASTGCFDDYLYDFDCFDPLVEQSKMPCRELSDNLTDYSVIIDTAQCVDKNLDDSSIQHQYSNEQHMDDLVSRNVHSPKLEAYSESLTCWDEENIQALIDSSYDPVGKVRINIISI
jgi:hypothetical protein